MLTMLPHVIHGFGAPGAGFALTPGMTHDEQEGSLHESFNEHGVELPVTPLRTPRHRSSVTIGVATLIAMAGIVTVFPGSHRAPDAHATGVGADSPTSAAAPAAASPEMFERAPAVDSAPPMDVETEDPPAEFMPGSAPTSADSSALLAPSAAPKAEHVPSPGPTQLNKRERKSGDVSAPVARSATSAHPLGDGLNTGSALPASGLDVVPTHAPPALPSPGQPNGGPSPTAAPIY